MAQASFGNPAVMWKNYLEQVRHPIQVIADQRTTAMEFRL